MGGQLKVLFVEASEENVLPIVDELRRGGYDPDWKRVDTSEAMNAALEGESWDIVFSDYAAPHLSAIDALAVLTEKGLDLPFIIVSGRIGAEAAVAAVRAGAHDCIVKDNLEKLLPAVERELEDAESRRESARAEQVLRESEAKYRDLVENITDVLYVLDRTGKATFVSFAVGFFLGYIPSEIVGRPFSDFIHPEDRPRLKENFLKTISGQSQSNEYRVLTKSGEIRWVRASARPILESNRIVGVRGMLMDITDRKEAEEALRQSEQRYRSLVDNSLTGIYVTQDDMFRFANKRLKEMFGYTEKELFARPLLEFIHPDDREDVRQRGIQRYAGQPTPAYGKFRAITKSGDVRWIEVIATLVEFRGKPAILGNLSDITERKQAEDALRESEARYRRLSENLEETVKSKVAELKQAETLATIGRMVSTVAHEVRNPLQNIQIGVDTMRQEIGDHKELTEILEGIEYGVSLLNGIITELLDYSRPLRLRHSPVSIRDVVERALKTQARRLSGIDTNLELDGGDRRISVDAPKFSAVLVNLIANAAEAMPRGGELTIRSKLHGPAETGTLRLSVSDTGCGIGREYMERIEEPFFTTKITGTGLGLPICRKIIEAHGGSLTIRSEPEQGTTVEILLPQGGSQPTKS